MLRDLNVSTDLRRADITSCLPPAEQVFSYFSLVGAQLTKVRVKAASVQEAVSHNEKRTNFPGIYAKVRPESRSFFLSARTGDNERPPRRAFFSRR